MTDFSNYEFFGQLEKYPDSNLTLQRNEPNKIQF